jgi:hypothetical protein
MVNGKRKTADANLSNAGDDFHILWTIQKALELLNFENDGLKALALEGLITPDLQYVDPDGDVCLGVDLTEYYSGENFEEASRVVVSQLKYSTRHPQLEWTAARLCAGKNGKVAGSVIDRLSEFYKAHLKKFDRKDVVKKIKLKLVTNRPASSKLVGALTDLKTQIETQSTPSYTNAKNQLSTSFQKEIERIRTSSKLKGQDLIDFLLSLDFSDCHADSRLDQHKNLLFQINKLGSNAAQKQYDSLHGLVWKKMLPDAQHNNAIKITDVLYTFGLSELTDLFPVDQKFEKPKHSVARAQANEIIALLKTSVDKLFYLHGGAGLGKSTIVNQVTASGDNDISFVLFDCYGGGSYLDPEDKRHRHERAMVQLSNMLARSAESPLLVWNGLSEDECILQFKRRIEVAVSAMRATNPKATLCFIIDAADNSVRASEKYDHTCFVHDLVNINIPNGCKILLTSRTVRVPSLRLPSHAIEIKLKEFTTPETSALLSLYGHTLNEPQVEEFRTLTLSTPRVMSYILEMDGEFDFNMMSLKPSGKSLKDIFKIQIEIAEKKIGAPGSTREFLSYLISLPRPVPLNRIQKIVNMPAQLISDLGTDLWHGIILENEKFSLRDEDFENFLRDEFPINQSGKERIADTLIQDADLDEYSSVHLGRALADAGRIETLENVVIEKKYLKLPSDPIRNKETFVERTRLAMKNSQTLRLNFLKLQIIAAEATKTNQILERILLDNPELASVHSDIKTNQRLYFQSGNPAWFGRVHFRSAAVFSRKESSRQLAEDHLRKANAWLDYRRGLPVEKAREFEINSTDIAYGAEAILRMHGASASMAWLSRWQPESLVYDSTEELLNTLIETSQPDQVTKWLSKAKQLRVDILLLIFKVYFEHGLKPPFSLIGVVKKYQLLERKARTGKGLDFNLKKAIVCYCEYALASGMSYKSITPLAALVSVTVPAHAPTFYGSSYGGEPSDRSKIDLLLRLAVIRNRFEGTPLSSETFYPPKLLTEIQSKDYEVRTERANEKDKIDRIYKHCINLFQARASFIFRLHTEEDSQSQFEKAVNGLMQDWELRHRYNVHVRDMYHFLAHKMSDAAFYADDNDTANKIHAGFQRDDTSNVNLYLNLADRFSVVRRFDNTTTSLLGKAELEIEKQSMAASETIELYTQASITASRISRQLGKHFFDKMVNASSDVDLDAFDQIKVFNKIAHSDQVLRLPDLAHAYARYVEFCGIQLRNWDHFPWDEGFESVVKLDLPSSMAILCRWDHRDTRTFDYNIVDVLFVALEQNFIDHLTAASLLELNQHYWAQPVALVKLILDKFDQSQDHIGKTKFVQNWFQKLKLFGDPGHSSFKEIFDHIKSRRFLDGSVIDELEQYIQIFQGFQVTKVKSAEDIREENKQDIDERYVSLSTVVSPLNPSDIENYFAKLTELNEHGYVNEKAAFELIRDAVTKQQRTGYLTALCELNSRITSYHTFEDNLTETLHLWNDDIDIQKWKQANFPIVLKALFSHFTSYDYLDTRSIERLMQIFDSNREELAKFIVSTIPDKLDDLSSKILFSLIELTHTGLPENDKISFLDWLVKRWKGNVKPDFGEGEFSTVFCPSDNSDLMAARMTRYFLGHPEKRIRWNAAHAVHKFVDFNKMSVVKHLVEERNHPTYFQFHDTQTPCLWISAHLYLWVALEHASIENHTSIGQLSVQMIQELANKQLPHALIRYYIKSTCLRLIAKNPALFSSEQQAVIRQALTGKTQVVKQKHHKRLGFRRDEMETQFDFDTLDTLPYWFGPLGDVFDISDGDVAKVADKFIHQYWGFTGDINKENKFTKYDYQKRSNRKGDHVEVEDLKKYYEFNSMCCAAVKLLETTPVKKESSQDYDPYDSFENWLNRWITAWPDYWLSDLRDPTPLAKRFWVKDEDKDRDWQWTVKLEDFDDIIGLSGADLLRPDFLVVHGSHDIHYHKDYESAHVSSALVNIDTAPALLRAFQTGSRHNFHLRFEREEDYWEKEEDIDERFKLTGWIRHVKSDGGSLDETDSYGNIGKDRVVLGDVFLKWNGAKVTPDYRYVLDSNTSEIISISEAWTEMSDDDRYGEFESSGNRLLVKRNVLKKFLKSVNKCLILCCDVNRYLEYTEYKEYFEPSHLIYLIYPDGKVSTIIQDNILR